MPNDIVEALKTRLKEIGENKGAKKIERAEAIGEAGPEFYNAVEAAAELAVASLPDEIKAQWLQFAKVIIAFQLMNFIVAD